MSASASRRDSWTMVTQIIRDEKAVKNAINRLYQGDYRINDATIDLREEPEINDD